MIETIHLKNFKGFKNTEKIDLKPLTILSGTNSSGKSTIIQSILMLKQTFESQSKYKTILLNGQFIHLGSFEDLIYDKDTNNTVNIHFEINPFKMSSMQFGARTSVDYFLMREFNFGNPTEEDNYEKILEIDFGLKLPNPSAGKEPDVDYFIIRAKSISPSNQIYEGTEIKFEKKDNQEYLITWKKTRPYYFESERLKIPKDINRYFCPNCNSNHRTNSEIGKNHYYYSYVSENHIQTKVSFINLIPDIGIETEIEKWESSKIPYYHLARPLFSLRSVFQSVYQNLFYIGPLREEPSRRYIYEEEYVDIGNRGENAPFILARERFNEISPYYFYDAIETKWNEINSDTLENGVNRWLNYMDISEGCELKSEKEIIRLLLPITQDKTIKVTLADVGFGVSQILPILVEGLRLKPNQTLILEQPEIHLHPKLQMQLADFFISMILSGKRIILETHSDHILNRIVRRIIESDDNNIISKTNILFFEQGIEGSKPRKVEIDGSRGIINWPKGFFDQTAEEAERIILSGIQKRRKNKMG